MDKSNIQGVLMNPMAPESTFNPLPLKMFLSSPYQPRSLQITQHGGSSPDPTPQLPVCSCFPPFAQYLTHTHTGAGCSGNQICTNCASCPLPHKIRKNTPKTAILPKECGISHPAPFPSPSSNALCCFPQSSCAGEAALH